MRRAGTRCSQIAGYDIHFSNFLFGSAFSLYCHLLFHPLQIVKIVMFPLQPPNLKLLTRTWPALEQSMGLLIFQPWH